MKEYRIQNTECRLILLIGLSVMAVLFTGCRPKGILHSGEMKDVLVDLHKTDALIQLTGLQYGHDEAVNIYYAQVMEKHGITQAQFDSSIVWYTAHPLLFDKIYPKVDAQLKAELEAFQKQYAEELSLQPQQQEPARKPAPKQFTKTDLDSVLWVTQHGYPSTWKPLVHNTEDQLLPQIGILR